MNKDEIFLELNRTFMKLTSGGFDVAFVSLYGSQNYQLDIYSEEYLSDLDFKAVVVPSLDDLIENEQPVSRVVELENGQCDIKDIRTYVGILLKASPPYIETLYSPFIVINPIYKKEIDRLRELKEALLQERSVQFVKSIYGMMCEKEKAMTHPYPSIIDKIERFGYDPKQTHHILRLFLIMEEYIKSGKVSLIPTKEEKAELIKIKIGSYSLDEAKKITTEYMIKAKMLKEEYLANFKAEKGHNAADEIDKISKSIIKSSILREIGRQNQK